MLQNEHIDEALCDHFHAKRSVRAAVKRAGQRAEDISGSCRTCGQEVIAMAKKKAAKKPAKKSKKK